MKTKIKKIILPYAVIVVMLFLVTDSRAIIDTVKSTLILCFSAVIPSLFPFMVLSSALTVLCGPDTFRFMEPVTKVLFGMKSACITPVVCGLICGFPIGAKTSAQLYMQGKISKSEAETLMAFANNPGPMFVLGTIGTGMFHSLKTGIVLYAIQLFVSLSAALVLRFFTTSTLNYHSNQSKSSQGFSSCVCDSVIGTLNICGFIVLFAVVIRLINPVCDIIPPKLSTLLKCVIEITNGIYCVSKTDFNMATKVSLASFALGWSGFSVHMQVRSVVHDTGLSMKKYYITKSLMSVCSAAITFLIMNFYDTINLFIIGNNVILFALIFVIFLRIAIAVQKSSKNKESAFPS